MGYNHQHIIKLIIIMIIIGVEFKWVGPRPLVSIAARLTIVYEIKSIRLPFSLKAPLSIYSITCITISGDKHSNSSYSDT